MYSRSADISPTRRVDLAIREIVALSLGLLIPFTYLLPVTALGFVLIC